MLRSLLPSEPELIKLISVKAWDEVINRAKTHPSEANPSHSANRGIGPTALSAAIRGGAQLETIKVLTEANIDQLVRIRHYRQGTVIHEAIKHQSSVEVILYLIKKTIEYESKQQWLSRGELKPACAPLSPVEVGEFYEAPTLAYGHSSILNQTDDHGRCPLHYLIRRAATFGSRDSQDGIICAVHALVEAFPPSVGKLDNDGYTPLDFALITHSGNRLAQDLEVEMRVFGLCNILIKSYPMAACPSKSFCPDPALTTLPPFSIGMSSGQMLKPTRPRLLPWTDRLHGRNNTMRSRNILSNAISGRIKHNPLSHALLYGRHLSTIELLLEASGESHTSWHTGHIHHDWEEGGKRREYNEALVDQSCMAFVTRDLEVALHVAVTMRASSEVVRQVLASAQDAAAFPDRCNLTPACWVWVRFVIDQIERNEQGNISNHSPQFPAVRASKRRYFPPNFIDCNDAFTEGLSKIVDEIKSVHNSKGSQYRHLSFQENNEEREMRLKLSALLPCAAGSLSTICPEKSVIPGIEKVVHWSPLHAAAFLTCPRAIVLQSIIMDPWGARNKDHLGNLPIHYAAAREGFSRELPLGVTSTPSYLSEVSVVYDLLHLYLGATKIANLNGQLPLHVAIAFEKCRKRQAHDDHLSHINSPSFSQRMKKLKAPEFMEGDSTALYLARSDPDSLESIDGITGLYPFMQAAAGAGGTLVTIYKLLRECPTII